MNAAILNVTADLLLDALKMPPGSVVRDVRMSFDTYDLQIVIEHPSLPEVKEGERFAQVVAEFTSAAAGEQTLVRFRVIG